MYIEIVRQVVKAAVSSYANSNSLTESDVLLNIRKHIDHTSTEHYNDEPNIEYNNPLCRLGYLYRHVSAHATLFDHVLSIADEVWPKSTEADQQVLRVCAAGGGPGTELLGIAKHLLSRPHRMPRKIEFTVLDNVPQWAETWQPLAGVVEDYLASSLADRGIQPPTVAPVFLPFDVLDISSYQDYAFQFEKADIVVFNYLFSENKTRLASGRPAVERLAELTPHGCSFVIIDRRESDPAFQDGVVNLFESVFGDGITVSTYDGTLESDEQAEDMGEELMEVLGSPRIKFFRPPSRDPTVLWFVATREQL